MKKLLVIQLLAFLVINLFGQPKIETLPNNPYITLEEGIQYLEFDFIVNGQGDGKYFLERIELDVYYKNDEIIQRHKVEDEGMVSPFMMFPTDKIKRTKTQSFFNPFYFFKSTTDLYKLLYTFTFSSGKDEYQVTKVVRPTIYEQKTSLLVPLKGALLVDNGFDHFAHHRRLNTTHWGMKLIKINKNITRYAIDFVHVVNGEVFKNNGQNVEDYYGFGEQVYAPADGKIIEVENAYPDNEIDGKLAYGFMKFIKNPKLASGNYVVIDHGNGEASLLAHLKQSSISVQLGQQVKVGDLIGLVGNSGDSTYPHLHYQLENEHSLNTETYPAKFSGINRLNGKSVNEQPVFCNTGDIIE